MIDPSPTPEQLEAAIREVRGELTALEARLTARMDFVYNQWRALVGNPDAINPDDFVNRGSLDPAGGDQRDRPPAQSGPGRGEPPRGG